MPKLITYKSLNEKQVDFTACVGKLLVYASIIGHDVILAEAYRTPEQAAIYAEQGKGIKNSVHTKKLAVDLFRYVNGKISWDPYDYELLATHWKSLHPLARWGGDFKNRDCVHFSFEHNGIR